VQRLFRHFCRALPAPALPRSERELVVIVAAVTWGVSTLAIEALSLVHGLAPAHPNAWRFGLGIPAVLWIATILRVGPRLGPRAMQRGHIVVWASALVVMEVLLFITPATFAVLTDVFVVALAVAYQANRRDAVVQMLALTAVSVTPLLFVLPGDASPRAPAWLAVFLPCLWAVTAVVHQRRAVVARALAEAHEQSLTDPLTGLANLRRLREATDAEMPPADRHHGGLLLIDLDNFKVANTLHGHLGGDHALRTVADALRHVAAPDHTVARVGGDEIAVLAPTATAAELEAFAVSYRTAVRGANERLELPGVTLDASVGVAARPRDGATLSELLTAADRSMYAVKATRPDRRTSVSPLRAAVVTATVPSGVAGPAGSATTEPSSTASSAYVWRVAGLLVLACAAMLISLTLPGADPANRTGIIGFCVAGILVALVVALAGSDERSLSHPVVDALSVAALAVLLYLSGGIDSQAVSFAFLIVLLQSGRQPPRGIRWRVVAPALAVLSPLLYQDPFADGHGPTRIALLVALLTISTVLTLTMYGTDVALERLRRRSTRRAATDPLTGLANRREFNRVLARALDAAGPDEGRELAVVMIDLDNFADVNSHHGHQVGDELLCDVAEALRVIARDEDCVARVGGDEFAAILPGAGLAGAGSLAERFVAAVADTASQAPDRVRANVGASAGFALHRLHGATVDDLVLRADEALMAVKRDGKRAVRVSAAG